jgi:hypothetical protein
MQPRRSRVYAYSYGRPPDHHPSTRSPDHFATEDLLGLQPCCNPKDSIRQFHEPYKDWGLTAISCQPTEHRVAPRT